MQMRAVRISVLSVAFVALMSAVAPAEAGRRLALIIGNSTYQQVSELPNPQNDAVDVADKLRSLSFDVMLGTNLTREQMHEAFKKFSEELKPGDEGLFFYAGHGISLSGENFLIPVDMPAEIKVEDEAKSKEVLDSFLVNISDVITPMQKAKLGMIFLDACRNTPSKEELGLQIVAQDGATRKLRALQFSRGMTKVSVTSSSGASGIFRAYATQPNNVSDDGGGRNSPFTKALLKHLGTQGVDVHQMMIKVRLDVQTETQGRQIPWEESALTDTYYFTPSAPGVAAPFLPTYKGDNPNKKAQKSLATKRNKSNGGGSSAKQARRNSAPPGLGAGIGAGL